MDEQEIIETCSSYIRIFEEYQDLRVLLHFKEYPLVYKSPSPHCRWYSAKELHLSSAKYERIIARFGFGTKLQRWLNSSPDFIRAREIFENKKWIYFLGSGLEVHSAVSFKNEVLWRFYRIVAGAILVYFDLIRFKSKLILMGEADLIKPSDRAIKAAQTLIVELENSDLYFSPKILKPALERIALGEAPSRRDDKTIKEDIPFAKRRRFMIREMSLLGNRLMILSASKKGRFPPDIVQLILKLVDIDTDIRTIQYIQKEYDAAVVKEKSDRWSDEWLPLTFYGVKNQRRYQIKREFEKQRREHEYERLVHKARADESNKSVM